MFICKTCCKKQNLIFLPSSRGPCELCGGYGACNDVNKDQIQVIEEESTSTCSGNECKLTYEDVVKMKEKFQDCENKTKELLEEHGIPADTKWRDPFALFMLKHGFDPENDFLIISERDIEKLTPYFPFIPSYVKVYKHVDGIMLVKGMHMQFKTIELINEHKK